jgi:alpha-ketoglutarate-dependent taurine dioxygenase
MNYVPLENNNGVRIEDVDLFDDQQAKDVGRALADNCIAVIDENHMNGCDRGRVHQIHSLWGDAYQSIILRALGTGDLKVSRHWRDVFRNFGYVASEVPEAYRDSQTSVTYKRNEKNKPVGIFAEGELGWHTDFPAVEDGHKVASLISVHDTENSVTEFLPTPKIYQGLNHEDRTMVDELTNVYKVSPDDMEKFFPGLGKQLPMQRAWTRWSGIPFDEQECPLSRTTASGVRGINFPNHGFSHFKGMSQAESEKYRSYLWDKLNKPENIYTHNWQDGQWVMFDLDITLHRRPTNVTHGNKRYLVRTSSYLDKLYPGHGRDPKFVVDGKRLSYQEALAKADSLCKEEFEAS